MTAALLWLLEEEGQTEASDKAKPNKNRRGGKKGKTNKWSTKLIETFVRN